VSPAALLNLMGKTSGKQIRKIVEKGIGEKDAIF